MKTLLLLAMLAASLAVGACDVAQSATNTAKNYAIEEGKKEIANRAGVCPANDEALKEENDRLKAEAVEKDKKITWLRKKAKDAGADLTK